MPIQVPPLRERTQDIPALVSHSSPRLVPSGYGAEPFSGGALRRLQRRHWPGNVRELRNAVERLLILAAGDEVTERCRPGSAADSGPQIDPEKFGIDATEQDIPGVSRGRRKGLSDRAIA